MSKVNVDETKATEELASKVAHLEQELAEVNGKLETAEKTVETLTSEKAALATQVEDAVKLAAEAENAQKEAESKKTEAEEQVKPLAEELAEQTAKAAELETVRAELESARTEIGELTEKLKGADEEISKLKDQFANISAHLEVKGETPLVENAAEKEEEKSTDPRESAEYTRYQALQKSNKKEHKAEMVKLARHPNVLAALEAEAGGQVKPAVSESSVTEEELEKYRAYERERGEVRALEGRGSALSGEARQKLAERKRALDRTFVANAEVFARCAEAVG